MKILFIQHVVFEILSVNQACYVEFNQRAYADLYETILAALQQSCFKFIRGEGSNVPLNGIQPLPHTSLASLTHIPIAFGQLPGQFQLHQPPVGKTSSNNKFLITNAF
jgi:hypothetical protein